MARDVGKLDLANLKALVRFPAYTKGVRMFPAETFLFFSVCKTHWFTLPIRQFSNRSDVRFGSRELRFDLPTKCVRIFQGKPFQGKLFQGKLFQGKLFQGKS